MVRPCPVAEQLENVELQVHALGNAANAALLCGSDSDAARGYARALLLARGRGLHRQMHMMQSGAALAALFAGGLREALQSFRSVVESRSVVPMTLGFVGAVGLRLRGLLEGEADLDRLDVEATFDNALRLREPQVIAIVAGASARTAIERGDRSSGANYVRRALPALTEPDHAYWLCEAAADLVEGSVRDTARSLLVRAGAESGNPAARAFLLSFDARVLARAERAESRKVALEAAQMFAKLGRPIEAASAFEIAGEIPEARKLYEGTGALRALHRLQGSPKSPATIEAIAVAADLTRREREVAEFAARGYASRLIASELGIGERTVETHLAVVYRKLGVKSRTELAALLGPPT